MIFLTVLFSVCVVALVTIVVVAVCSALNVRKGPATPHAAFLQQELEQEVDLQWLQQRDFLESKERWVN